MSVTKVSNEMLASDAVITRSSSDPTASTNPSGGVGTVFLNTTSGEMWTCTNATAGSNIWKNIGDGTIGFLVATGGTITTDGDYKVHVFNSSGTFEVTTLGDGNVRSLIIAGGGGGGTSGGGAGGYLATASTTLTLSSWVRGSNWQPRCEWSKFFVCWIDGNWRWSRFLESDWRKWW